MKLSQPRTGLEEPVLGGLEEPAGQMELSQPRLFYGGDGWKSRCWEAWKSRWGQMKFSQPRLFYGGAEKPPQPRLFYGGDGMMEEPGPGSLEEPGLGAR